MVHCSSHIDISQSFPQIFEHEEKNVGKEKGQTETNKEDDSLKQRICAALSVVRLGIRLPHDLRCCVRRILRGRLRCCVRRRRLRATWAPVAPAPAARDPAAPWGW